MLPTTIRSPPELSSFVPLEEYQSQTPETFFGGKPVLHHHLLDARAWILRDQAASLPVFTAGPNAPAVSVPEGVEASASASASASAASSADETANLTEAAVDIFVNSENFTIFSASAGSGIEIPYPAISIHAVKQITSLQTASTATEKKPLQAIWMQLELSMGSGHDDDDGSTGSVDLTIIPPLASDGTQGDVQALYKAISECSDLHPDPADEDEDEEDDNDDRIVFEGEHEAVDGFSGVLRGNANGGLPPPFPGSGGWITAENLHEYFDADGNWIGEGAEGEGEEAEAEAEEGVSGELGEGAGRVRVRAEANGHGDGGEEDSENKRARVDGAESTS